MTVSASDLREGQQIFVTGTLIFSRLARPIEGQALTESVIRAKQRGQKHPTNVPHTTVNIADAQILPTVAGQFTPEEQFVQEHMYVVKSGDNAGKTAYGIDNKGTKLPIVLEKTLSGAYTQTILERDLAVGLSVTLVLNVFKSTNYDNRGIGIAQVLVNEPIRYYGGGAVDKSALAARGIVIEGDVQIIDAANLPALGEEVEQLPTVEQDGYAFPAPPAAAPAAPVPAPVAAPVVAAVVPAAPVPAPAPVPAAPAAPAAAAPATETPAEKIARLRKQLEDAHTAAAASGGDSAFTAPVEAAPGSPWENDAPGISYGG